MTKNGMVYKFRNNDTGVSYYVSQAARDAYLLHCAAEKKKLDELRNTPEYIEAKAVREKLLQKQNDANWYDRNKGRIRARIEKMRLSDPLKYATYMRNWYLVNRERILARKAMRDIAKRAARGVAA